MSATESSIMTNVIASPAVMHPVGEKHARQRVDICRVVVPASPGAGEILRLTKMKAHNRITSIRTVNDADANATDVNVGIWTPSGTTADPVVIDADGLVDGADLSSAIAFPTEILGTGLTNPEDFGKALWEYCAAGPASAPTPGTEYEICAQIVGDAVGCDQTYIIEYTAGD